MFVVATAAAVIASQAMILGVFSIVVQSMALGCFPRCKIVHTSPKYEGQIYIPEINWALMVMCIIVTAALQDTAKIGNAYGVTVVAVIFKFGTTTIIIFVAVSHSTPVHTIGWGTHSAEQDAFFRRNCRHGQILDADQNQGGVHGGEVANQVPKYAR